MRRFLILPLLVTLASGGVFSYLIYYIDPFTGYPPQIIVFHHRVILFLLSAFFFLAGFSSLILYLIRRLLGDYLEPRYTYRKCLRQGSLIGLGVVVCALLFITQTANLVTVALTVGVMISLEFTLRG
ncbi:hypothetical protein KJ596_03180 [Patescibacteria group bacterium]|nr:hypothetical protein [Patescibacteria group bacterium]MBU1868423.1 hypothetical protein [Patescibacteria group bacterium]